MKLNTLLVIALAVYLIAATGDFRVTAHSTIEGETQRALVAPYNGFIYETQARAGDVLKAGALRPGMEGIGKVMIDRRKRIWIWTHQLVNWARLKAWSWMP